MPKKPEAQLGPELIVGRRIRQERQAREWTLDTLSRRLARETGAKVPASALSMVENGKRRITLNEALAYAKVFGVDLAELLDPKPGAAELQEAMLNAIVASTAASEPVSEAIMALHRLRDAATADIGGEVPFAPLKKREATPDLTAIEDELFKVVTILNRVHRLLYESAKARTPVVARKVDEWLSEVEQP